MITADNLNLDVLEHIFSLVSEHDLPSIAIVNQSFSAAVFSRLYKTIPYRLRHSKGYINVSFGFIPAKYLNYNDKGRNNFSIFCHSIASSPWRVRSTYR